MCVPFFFLKFIHETHQELDIECTAAVHTRVRPRPRVATSLLGHGGFLVMETTVFWRPYKLASFGLSGGQFLIGKDRVFQ